MLCVESKIHYLIIMKHRLSPIHNDPDYADKNQFTSVSAPNHIFKPLEEDVLSFLWLF